MGTWWPTGMLPGRESWSLYLSVLYPIRVSPSITPYIQRMRTAFTKLHAPSRPLFTLLAASLLLLLPPPFSPQPLNNYTQYTFSLFPLSHSSSLLVIAFQTHPYDRMMWSSYWPWLLKNNVNTTVVIVVHKACALDPRDCCSLPKSFWNVTKYTWPHEFLIK